MKGLNAQNKGYNLWPLFLESAACDAEAATHFRIPMEGDRRENRGVNPLCIYIFFGEGTHKQKEKVLSLIFVATYNFGGHTQKTFGQEKKKNL